MKQVDLIIKREYLQEILAGTKKEEYRSLSKFNTRLLCDNIDRASLIKGDHYIEHNKEVWRPKKNITHVRFLNGYRKDREYIICELKSINIDKFIKEIPDGMEPGTVCFTLELGQIVEHNWQNLVDGKVLKPGAGGQS